MADKLRFPALSAAILHGCKKHPLDQLPPGDLTGAKQGRGALQAAYAAEFGIDPKSYLPADLAAVHPILSQDAGISCPAGPNTSCPPWSHSRTVEQAILHLEDEHGFTRERVAAWVQAFVKIPYSGFPTFSDWARGCAVADERYEAEMEPVRQSAVTDAAQFTRALEVVKRAASIETGAIEGLYATDWHLTTAVALEGAGAEAAMDAVGKHVRPLFESQLRAYGHVVELTKGGTPLAEAWIRDLHATVCEPQDTYVARLPDGSTEERHLRKGEYKEQDNFVLLPSGRERFFAPVLDTAPEMARLVEELRSAEFHKAHPVLQAAFAHHAFVSIHPFEDGNGRVARALASVFLVRDTSLPLFFTSENREEYFSVLADADEGNRQVLVDFVLERAIDSARLAAISLRAATRPRGEDEVRKLERLFKGPGGIGLESLDGASELLMRAFSGRLAKAGEMYGQYLPQLWEQTNVTSSELLSGFRYPVKGVRVFGVRLTAPAPANVVETLSFHVQVPTVGSEIRITGGASNDLDLRARLSDVYPKVSTNMEILMAIEAERLLAELANRLRAAAVQKLRELGFGGSEMYEK